MLALALALIAQADAGPVEARPIPPVVIGEIRSSEKVDGDVRGVVNALTPTMLSCLDAARPQVVVVAVVLDKGGAKPKQVLVDHPVHVAPTAWPNVPAVRCLRDAMAGSELPLHADHPFSVAFIASTSGLAFPKESPEEVETALARVRSSLQDILDDANPSADAPETQFDRFKNITRVSTPIVLLPPVGLGMRTQLVSLYSGRDVAASPEPQTGFLIHAGFESWHWLKCHSAAMLVDDKPVELLPESHDGDVVRGGVTETIIIMLPRATLDALASASKVELRICHDEMAVEHKSLRRLHRLIADVTPPPKP